jgi:hypothetical protein
MREARGSTIIYDIRDMTPEVVQPQEPDSAQMGAFSRITGVFFEPGKTFADIGRRPTWVAPVLLLILVTMAVTFTMGQKIGWEQMVRQQIESNPRTAQMTAEQREAAIAMQTRMGGFFAYLIPIFLPVYYLILSGVLLGITAMMSAGLKFKQVFAVVTHANLPGVVSAVLMIVVMFLKNPSDFNFQNPLAFNPAAFMDPQTSSKFLYSLATSLDLFSFWIIFLLATGLHAAAGKKLSFGGAMTAVVAPWALWVLGKSALAGLFS